MGNTSREVPALLKGEPVPPAPPRPAFPDDGEPAFFIDENPRSLERTAEEAAKLVFRGILRGDLYIITHSEFYEGVKARYDAVLRAFPKDKPNEAFKRFFSFLTYNPAFEKQREYL